MNEYRHILFAMDYSEESFKVGQKAKMIAARNHAKFTVLHVLEEINIATGFEMMPLISDDANDSESVQAAKAAMTEMAERLGLSDAQTHVVVAFSTKEGINQSARELGADLIVVGSHTRHGLALLLGSTANAILNDAPCDVLAVKI